MEKSIITEAELLLAITALTAQGVVFMLSPEEKDIISISARALEEHTGFTDPSLSVLAELAKTVSRRLILKLWRGGHRSSYIVQASEALDVVLPQSAQQHGSGSGAGDYKFDFSHPLITMVTLINLEKT